MTHTVVGLFDDRAQAQAAMNELIAQGFVKENIDISNRSFASGTDNDSEYAITSRDTDTSSGEGIGDRISNFFSSLFDEDDETARTYTNAASEADAILTVQVDSNERARTAQEIFDRHGAFDVDERGSSTYAGADNLRGTSAMDRNTRTADTDLKDRQTIPVVKEDLKVGKRDVERGGARIRSRIIERPVEENIRLREEHVVVNRRPVDREISDADLKNFRPGEMELTEHAEVPIVGKQARVVEEVEVGKNVTERQETVRDTVRSTDVDVEQIDDKTHTKSKRARS